MPERGRVCVLNREGGGGWQRARAPAANALGIALQPAR